jgi:hypothetical protein
LLEAVTPRAPSALLFGAVRSFVVFTRYTRSRSSGNRGGRGRTELGAQEMETERKVKEEAWLVQQQKKEKQQKK